MEKTVCPDCGGDGQKQVEGVWCDCPTGDGLGTTEEDK
jgi:hypothetical protein